MALDQGDLADILAQDDPAIWTSNRPAEGGETGAMFQKIIERALALRGETAKGAKKKAAPAKAAKKTTATKTAKRKR